MFLARYTKHLEERIDLIRLVSRLLWFVGIEGELSAYDHLLRISGRRSCESWNGN